MPKDPKRNIQNYQLRGGHLNEYEFQKSQSEMAQESELPFTNETDKPNLAQATKRLAEVTAEAHGIVEQRKLRGLVKSGGRKSVAAKRSAKKVATKSAKKTATRADAKKRASALGKRSAKKVAIKSTKKATTRADRKKRTVVKK